MRKPAFVGQASSFQRRQLHVGSVVLVQVVGAGKGVDACHAPLHIEVYLGEETAGHVVELDALVVRGTLSKELALTEDKVALVEQAEGTEGVVGGGHRSQNG